MSIPPSATIAAACAQLEAACPGSGSGVASVVLPHRSDWNLGPVMWYSLRDNAPDTDAGAKPSWNVYTARSGPAGLLDLPQLH